ncbi:murein biosynthesis integral membrane protein MurJ [Clostridium estertheticum]|uniref:Probable lipid II flippase MurJ n=1 Tax=Clostridium estertheticum TaxID=238834 RepID=A0A7Y3WT16_9CLOT|nr:murein biosynthesis integral membrane protein MurJ [Clostridium estertheticum]MBW9171030.1 murein biosynthesis integral membrane protein MurJ [Clostridium estertheticum]NNU76529.1 murein biosynthesis integral membrane protein MurJ [Clostridium estertheticum]WBL46017.1 murein biosynthesis integral membrane protein MurJ [Clostridium estertheticum]WLC74105.1 murein biosynthesis integral membrane protein MurJ [Clostridium estertheticum]
MKENKVLKSSMIVMLFVIVGKILGIVRDSLVFAKFGTSHSSDIYVWCFGIVYLFTSLGYGLSTTIIPVLTEYIETKDTKERNSFVNNVTNTSMLATVIITGIGILFSYYIVYYFANNLSNDPMLFKQTVKILRIMFLSVLFLTLQGVVAGALQAHKEFSIPSAMAAAANLIYIIYLSLFVDKFGLTGFAITTVLAFFIQFIINVPKFRKLGYRYKLEVDFKDKDLRKMFILMIPIIISTATMQFNLFINRSFAIGLYEGAASILDCANKVTLLTYEVFAVAVSMIIYPILSTFIVQNNHEEYKKSLVKSINIINLVMIPAALAIVILREPLISVLYLRGKFTISSMKLVSEALVLYSPTMVAYGVRDVLNRAFYSAKDTKTPMIYSVVGVVINVVLSAVLYRHMLVPGLALSSSISSVAITLMLFLKMNKKFPGIQFSSMAKTVGKISIASIIMGVIIYLMKKIFIINLVSGFVLNLTILFVCAAIGSILYFVLTYFFKIEETMYVWNIFKSKISKK